jgi:hypothetical protein
MGLEALVLKLTAERPMGQLVLMAEERSMDQLMAGVAAEQEARQAVVLQLSSEQLV